MNCPKGNEKSHVSWKKSDSMAWAINLKFEIAKFYANGDAGNS